MLGRRDSDKRSRTKIARTGSPFKKKRRPVSGAASIGRRRGSLLCAVRVVRVRIVVGIQWPASKLDRPHRKHSPESPHSIYANSCRAESVNCRPRVRSINFRIARHFDGSIERHFRWDLNSFRAASDSGLVLTNHDCRVSLSRNSYPSFPAANRRARSNRTVIAKNETLPDSSRRFPANFTGFTALKSRVNRHENVEGRSSGPRKPATDVEWRR